MKKTVFVLAISCIPLMLDAAENTSVDTSGNPWVVHNVLYSDENCGEPVAYLDERGNILSRIESTDIELTDQVTNGSGKR